MPKVWLCGQFGTNSYEYIVDYITRLQYFDGGVFSVNFNSREDKIYDKVFPLIEYKLDQYRSLGEVFYTRWSNDHAIAPNIILHSGHFEEGDWICFMDAPELLKEDFARDIKNKIKEWDSKGIVAVGWNRIYIFKWHDQLTCGGSPHQGFQGIRFGSYLELADESTVEYTDEGCHFGSFMLNRRKQENSHILHAVRYTFVYPISNQLQLFYQGDEFVQHETQRREFRRVFEELIGKTTMENLKKLMEDINDNNSLLNKIAPFPIEIIEYFDYEPIYRDYFRLEILKTPLQEILDTRKSWSFKDYYSTLQA